MAREISDRNKRSEFHWANSTNSINLTRSFFVRVFPSTVFLGFFDRMNSIVKKGLIDKVADICKRNAILDLYAFGSRGAEISEKVRGSTAVIPTQHTSDVDIGAVPAKLSTFGPSQRIALVVELEDLFDAYRVDLVVLSEADPFLALEVVRGELLYTDNPDRQSRHELYILRRAGDLMPLKKERMRMILEEAAR
jgi:hypothetical protein